MLHQVTHAYSAGPAAIAALGDLGHWGGSLATLETMGRLVGAIFLFAFGACVGSFLNVVIYRLPAGLSVVTPPSRCPFCGGQLSWRENLPVIGWILLRGRCRHCQAAIALQYPLIEALIGALFAGVYLLYYAAPADTWLAEIAGPWWRAQGFAYSWPAYIALVFLLAGLVAMTLIDARTFTIPIEITRTVAVVGIVAAGVQALLPVGWQAVDLWPIPLPGWLGSCIGVGGMFGTLVACTLLATGRVAPSFADWATYVKESDPLSSYPHARREMGKELRFLFPILVGLAVGWVVGRTLGPEPPPLFVASVGGSCLGFVVGGAILWTIRILGTYLFGREALGLGDVHLLSAVGAVLGWRDTAFVMGIAPVLALSWVAVGLLVGRVLRRRWMEIPLGPYLAIATYLLVFARPVLARLALAFIEWEQRLMASWGLA